MRKQAPSKIKIKIVHKLKTEVPEQNDKVIGNDGERSDQYCLLSGYCFG